MSFLEKYRSKSEKLENKPVKNEPREARLNPFVEDMITNPEEIYDGNKALARDAWLKNADLETLNLLAKLHKKDGKKYSRENIAHVLAVFQKLKDSHDLDVTYITGRVNRTRLKIFPPTNIEQIINDIVSGEFDQYDEKYLIKHIEGGKKEYLEKIKYQTRYWKKMKEENEIRRQDRVAKFKEKGGSNQELLTTECPMVIVETHPINKFANALEAVNKNIPTDINRHLLKINYQEGINAAQSEGQTANLQDYQEITDRSGVIGENFLKQILKKGEKANFVLTGGNLRGCFSASLESIIKINDQENTKQVDIHIPLDKCYDNPGYDDLSTSNMLPTDLLKSKSRTAFEIYKDGEIIDVSTLDAAKDKTRVRLYLWSKSENFSQKLKDSLEIKKIKELVNKLPN
jgi:6-phosphogluconolactonase/glucosamine-6-phosphate isomerase/deaminase